MPFVYLLRCNDGSLYAGAAKDLPRRLAAHVAGRASRYTRARLPVVLVWFRRAQSWSAALRSERRIKALRRAEKDALVRGSRIGGVAAHVAIVRLNRNRRLEPRPS